MFTEMHSAALLQVHDDHLIIPYGTDYLNITYNHSKYSM